MKFKEDLRIIKTKEAIRKAFEEMICEMAYEKITIKELTNKAKINRKTFYLHYNCLDDLLLELQTKMADDFINKTRNLKRPFDMDKITREFFLTSEQNGKLSERLICCGSYSVIGQKITGKIMQETWGTDLDELDPYIKNIVMTYISQSTKEIYKQWVNDGKKIPLEEIIKITTELICSGLNGFLKS